MWNKLDEEQNGREVTEESDEKNFSMFKKTPSIRTAYTTKTTTDEFDLPQLEFTKYHPTLAEELSLEHPQKPFATAAAAAARQNSGVSWFATWRSASIVSCRGR